jgi:drug/metabolite transporter (DMT)-like permease
MRLIEWLMLIALSILWGGSFFFVEIAIADLPPFTLVLLRVGIAALALNLFVQIARVAMPTDWRSWRDFLIMGFLNNAVPFSLIVWGQTQIGGALASILNATTPLFTVVIAHGLTRDERLTGGRLAGAILGFVGVTVLIGSDVLHSLGASALAQVGILGAALSYACAAVFGRRFRRAGIAPAAAASGQVTASTMILLPVVLAIDPPWTLPLPGATAWGAVVGLALLSTALAYIIYFRVLATAGAVNLLLVTFLVPVSASALGIAVLGEQLAANHLIGMALIGLGLAAMDGRPIRRLRRALRGSATQPWRRRCQSARALGWLRAIL